MSKAYRIRADGATEPLDRIHVRNEEQDLQVLLERNPDLLAGEQIRPENPCRWLLVGREIAVPDPESGSDRWSLDLFFVDQDATPTLVECKRFEDTRSRREVVAQMLDYAANANYYWTRDDLLTAARESAARLGYDLDTQLSFLDPDWEEGAEAFFQRVEENLREGQVRMVFFLEESPWQLRSIVDFLNRQMERSEVLLVEARQYQDGDSRVVVPSLFGYTEEARRVKRTVSVNKPKRRQWDREMFLSEYEEQFGSAASAEVDRFISGLDALKPELAWGCGAKTGSVSPKWASVGGKAPITVYTDGKLYLNLPVLMRHPETEAFGARIEAAINEHTSLTIPETRYKKYPWYPWQEWSQSIDDLLTALRTALGQ